MTCIFQRSQRSSMETAMDRTPSCPKFGSQDVTVIGSHPMFAAGADFFGASP